MRGRYTKSPKQVIFRGYQEKLNPDLDHDDLITSNAYENVIDIIETHKYLDFESDERCEKDR